MCVTISILCAREHYITDFFGNLPAFFLNPAFRAVINLMHPCIISPIFHRNRRFSPDTGGKSRPNHDACQPAAPDCTIRGKGRPYPLNYPHLCRNGSSSFRAYRATSLLASEKNRTSFRRYGTPFLHGHAYRESACPSFVRVKKPGERWADNQFFRTTALQSGEKRRFFHRDKSDDCAIVPPRR